VGSNPSDPTHFALAHLRSRPVRSFPPSGQAWDTGLSALLQRHAVLPNFDLNNNLESVLKLLRKYADVPMSLADGCLVRMTETLADPLVLTADSDSASIAAMVDRLFPV
jgi:hypothetical protein